MHQIKNKESRKNFVKTKDLIVPTSLSLKRCNSGYKNAIYLIPLDAKFNRYNDNVMYATSKPNNVSNWYNSEYSWYCTGYAKNKNNEPRPFLSMEKNPVRARELLIWIQKAIPKRFPFLLKDEDDNVSVHPINNFLASYSISSCHLRKENRSRSRFQSAWR